MEFLESMKTMFRNSIPDMVIKYANIAKQYETVDSKRAGDRYVSAKMKTDTFGSYQHFTVSSLLAAGFTEAEAKEFSLDKNKIPKARRQFVINAMREEIINSYEEQNDYYRMLNGYPSVNDFEEVWLDSEVYDKYGITPTPIHLIDPNVLKSMEAMGELDQIKADYADREYLEYLGRKRIDPSVSRSAGNYQILFFPRVDGGETYYRDFMNMYEECREYFLTVIYNQYYVANYEYYENFIAFNILIMTINKMISTLLKRYVERDFYDIETIRAFLGAYGIEHNSVFTLTQLKLIAKNLNVLLQSKSSDKVFIDTLDLIGYSNFSIMKYYLVKQHIFDEDGKPIFHYDTVTDENGNETQVLDTSGLYEYYFVRSEVGTYDIQEALHDAANMMSYRDVVGVDDRWIEDERLIEKLNKSEFNYIETKYMDMNVMYRMHSIVFETIYLTRLVLDKSNTKSIFVTLPSIVSGNIALFDVFILLICLLCKYYGIEPDILKSPSKILHVLGYNFEADFESIKEEIRKRPDLDDRLIKYIRDMTFTSPADVNAMYVNVLELERLLVKLMNEAETYETYSAYDKLYRTLLWTELNNDIYKLPDGTIPDQFTDYLRESNSALYTYYLTIENIENVADATDYITSKLSNMFTDTKYLNYIKIMDTNQLDAIRNLLCFFKSYTVTMRDTNLILMLDSRYYNMIHMSSYCNFSGDGPTKLYIPDSTMMDLIIDRIFKMSGKETIDNHINLDTKVMFLVDNIIKLPVQFNFKPFLTIDMTTINDIFVNSGITDALVDLNTEGDIYLHTVEMMLSKFILNDYVPMLDLIKLEASDYMIGDIEVTEGVHSISTDSNMRHTMHVADKRIATLESFIGEHTVTTDSKVNMVGKSVVDQSMTVTPRMINRQVNYHVNDNMHMRDEYKFYWEE